jgi:periplasmic protein TonB
MSFQSHGRSSLARALAVSLLAHFLLLWPDVLVPPDPRPPIQPLRVSLATTATRLGGSPDPTAGDVVAKQAVRIAKVKQRPSPSVIPVPPEPANTVGNAGAEELRGYRLALARGAAAFRDYPRPAVVAGWHGTVEVQVDVTAVGAVQSHLLVSSGHEALDRSALEMARQALAATPLPPLLRGKVFSLTLPFIFDLAE